MSRILVTGAAGAVGSYVSDVFDEHELTLTDVTGDIDTLDVRDRAAVRSFVAATAPDVVLHLGAATDVDRCEREPEWAYRTNALGTENVARACRDAGALLVYVSTAAVFRGDKPEPYDEFDATAPANVYGRAKLAGERAVRALVPEHYVVRAGWMIGGGSRDTKFVGKLLELIEDGTQRLRVVDDKLGSPTYARDFLEGIRTLLSAQPEFGTYHLVNPSPATRYDVAVALRDALERPDVHVEPVSSAHFPLPAPRGRSEALRNYKLELLGLDFMRPWREALAEYLHGELLDRSSRDARQRAR